MPDHCIFFSVRQPCCSSASSALAPGRRSSFLSPQPQFLSAWSCSAPVRVFLLVPIPIPAFLGFKIADHVPYSIPLSWFYMGFTSLILASIIVNRVAQRHQTAWSLVLGAYFLTVWDLALDPAMASQYLPIHFWIWHDTGPYFGMPIQNLVGWSVTGLIFMSVSRLFWRTNLDTRRIASLAAIRHVCREYRLRYCTEY